MSNDEQTDASSASVDGASVTAGEPRICENCGSPIDTAEWHPVETRTDDDDFHVYAFCSDDCHDEWDGE